MRLIAGFVICMLYFHPALSAQDYSDHLPPSALLMLERKFPGWRFVEVSQEVRQFFETERKGESPHLISGDFDGNGRPDHAVLIWHGHVVNESGGPIGPQSYLVVFLRKGKRYQMHVIKDPDGEYLCLAKKGTRDYDYEKQEEISYANDAILTGIFEKGGSSYVYQRGKFRSFVSSD